MKKLFGTDGIRGKANQEPMTPLTMLKIAQSFANVLIKKGCKNGKPKIIIGKDTRISGYILETALTSGLCSMGVDVYLVGPLPTPAIAHLVKSFAADGGIMLTASHNPAEDNGIKFFDSDGFKLDDEFEMEIESVFFNEEINLVSIEKLGKAFRIEDAKGRYIEFAKASIKNTSLESLNLILDCANGATYNVAPQIFQELGAKVKIVNNQPDGYNINLNCGAQYPERISQLVKENKGIGITFDGDGDRVIFVDEQGEVVDGDELLAVTMQHFMSKGKIPEDTVVVTNYSNLGFDEFIKSIGGKVVRVKNGDRYVIEEMRKNGYTLGGEFSGHLIFGLHATTGDGVISALQILRVIKESKQKLCELRKCMKKYPSRLTSIEINKKPELDSIPEIKNVIEISKKSLLDSGRIHVRYSGTENKCRVLVEAKDQNLVDKVSDEVSKVIKEKLK